MELSLPFQAVLQKRSPTWSVNLQSFEVPSAWKLQLATIMDLFMENQERLPFHQMAGSTRHEAGAVMDWVDEPVSTGTTILAAEFDTGVVIAADSRTNMGAFVSNRISDKLTKITDYIYCCRSGSAADTQAIADIVKYHLSFYEMELGEPPAVKTAANLFRGMCYNYRDSLTAGIICAGWDKRYGGQVFAIPVGGMLARQPIALGGSGSTYIYGYVDSNFKTGMTKEDCVKFATTAVALAMRRDGSSGGVCRVGIITKDGIERRIVSGDDLPKFIEF